MEESTEETAKKYGIDLKIIIVGDLATGKTSIINRYINEKFDSKNRSTIAPEFSYKIIKSKDVIFRIQFWDIPGQNKNPELTGVFCRDTQGVIFTTEVNNKNAFENLKIWQDSLNKYNDIKNIPKILIENKCDLLGDESHYNDNFEKIKKFSHENSFLGCFRTSALNGYNVDKAINFLIDEIIKLVGDEEIQYYNSKIKMDNSYISQNTKNKNRCC